mgnify:CR=1 FL=1
MVRQADTNSLLAGALRWLSQRGSIAAQNVAQADMPGFRAKDLKGTFAESLKNRWMGRLKLDKTSENQLQGLPAGGAAVEIQDSQPSLSDNRVFLESEMTKLAELGEQSSVVAQLYRKNHQLVQMVLRGQKG